MTKRSGTTSDNGFIFKKINENESIKEKKRSCGRFWRAALTGHGQASQIAKMALFNPCMEFEIYFGPNDFILSV
jgi:hypothetical protein